MAEQTPTSNATTTDGNDDVEETKGTSEKIGADGHSGIVDSDDYEEEDCETKGNGSSTTESESSSAEQSGSNNNIGEGLPSENAAVKEDVSVATESKGKNLSLDTGALTVEVDKSTENENNNDDEDVASKAAVALAAVAAAATANNKSPAEAGREARDLAQNFIRTAASVDSNITELQTVLLSAVKVHLRQRALETGSAVTDRLCQGDNDAFLQHLLLMENFRCVDDTADQEKEQVKPSASLKLDVEENVESCATTEAINLREDMSAVATVACEKLELALRRIEAAYDCLVGMLPHTNKPVNKASFPSPQNALASPAVSEDIPLEDPEWPLVIPDLLPLCTTTQGDATVAFFRACLGEPREAANKKHSMLFVERSTSSSSLGSSPKPKDNKAASSEKDSQETLDKKPSEQTAPPSPGRHGGGGVFSSMFRRSATKAGKKQDDGTASVTSLSSSATGLSSVFRKKRSTRTINNDESSIASFSKEGDATGGADDGTASGLRPGEYVVKIEREMLGLTVENVLERTVVRTVVAGGPAKKAGAKVGSLIVKVGTVETKNLTHFETIDELRQSNRPLQLVMRQISDEALRSAREEMGRLIRGSGFGTIMEFYNRSKDGNIAVSDGPSNDGANPGNDGENQQQKQQQQQIDNAKPSGPLIGADLRIDAYTNMLHRKFAETSPQPRNKKEEDLARIGEKLVWILTLFVVGLEREASYFRRQSTPTPTPTSSQPHSQPFSHQQHSAKEYLDAAKSVSKVLYDYTRKKIDPQTSGHQRQSGYAQQSLNNKSGASPPPPPPPPPRGGRVARKASGVPGMTSDEDSSMIHEKPLLQIGDVLQRTRTFLADTMSPPAALLRGEVISFLCDVLDIDTEMELSEEEAVSATAGASASAINDLGSAGSLLKLIVLNCPIMRSPNCEDAATTRESIDAELEEELKRRFGPSGKISTVDLHKLHAGNRFLAVVHRLAASRSISARVTACSLGPVLWGHLDFPHQLQLRGVITRALHDVDVIVRKSTATVLHEIAELVFDKRSVPWLVLMCERAMTDPEPQLRSAAMTLTWHLAEHLPNAFLGDASQGSRYLRRLPNRDDPLFADVYLLQCKLLPVATRLAEDRSPSVRLAVAAQCDRLCDALGDHWSSVIIDVLHGLLTDSDERVRCEAVSCVPRISEIVLLSAAPGETAVSEQSILEALIPATIKLQKDPSVSVRVALAAAAGELLTLLVTMQSKASEFSSSDLVVSERKIETEGGKLYKSHVDVRLIPLVQTLLNDADPEVTSASLRAVTNATRSSVQQSRVRRMSVDDDASLSSHTSTTRDKPVFHPVLSENQVLRLLPTLTELADSRQWRVRQSAVEIVPALLGCTHQLETRTEISKLCVRLMGDQVDAVRKTAAECLCMGGSSLGSHGEDAGGQWITSIVIPNVRKCAIDSMSKQRLLSLKMIEVILLNGVCPAKWYSAGDNMSDSPMRELVSIALSLTHDRIANVRLNVGRVLESVLHVLEEQDISFIKEVLQEQLESERNADGGGDTDVLYFASRCINRAKMIVEDRSLLSQDSMTEL